MPRRIHAVDEETTILWRLCQNRGRVVSSRNLFEAAWGKTKHLHNSNTVIIYIVWLREKTCRPRRQPRFIKPFGGRLYH